MVGAGLGGSAVAYFLQQHFGPQVQLDVYEPAGVGGRLATVTVNKQQYESRGASIHALSLHMQDFVKILGEHRHLSACMASIPELGDAVSPGCAFGVVGRAPQACGDPLVSLHPSPLVPWKGCGGSAERQGKAFWWNYCRGGCTQNPTSLSQ